MKSLVRLSSLALPIKSRIPSFVLLLGCVGFAGFAQPLAAAEKPNFVIIFTDDQGYGDLGSFGGKQVSTPRLDRMAMEGLKLTSFYVAASVCTPSRAALMTGSYPRRIGMENGSNFSVLLAADTKGLNPEEITIAEVLKTAGYRTGMFGKWHLGDQPEFLPTRQGFDEFYGIPYSHDIHPYHPMQEKFQFPPLPLLDGEKVIELDPDADYLTEKITARAVQFIEKNKHQPFFLYIPHPLPHRPIHVSPPYMQDGPPAITAKLDKEKDTIDYRTRDALYNQSINEIDHSVGEILDALAENGLDQNTIVIFTSDNGPSIGDAGLLKGGKGSVYEGGMRVPAIIRWPGKISAGGVSNELMTAMDLLPTFAKLAGGEIPVDRVIDGKDIGPVLTAKAKSPHEVFFYHHTGGGVREPRAVRSGKWKLHLKNGTATQLFDLESDIGESRNVLAENPAIADQLLKHVKTFEKDLAQNSRPPGLLKSASPLSK